MKRLVLVLSAAACVLLSGCAFNAGYNPSYISAQPAKLDIPGKGLVVVSDTDAQWMYSGHPTSFTGGGTTLSARCAA